MNKEFAEQARETLNAKMENYEENREAIMSDLKEKLKVRLSHVAQHVNGIVNFVEFIFFFFSDTIPRNRTNSRINGTTEEC